MSNPKVYPQCPACRSAAISKVFLCKDHTVSKEVFEIWQCSACTLRFTQNAPNERKIAPYYQSADYISHSDTKKGLINQLYHRVRNYTLKGKRNLVQSATGKKEGVLLDTGAGTGAFAHTMQQAGWSVTGLEPDDSARQCAFQQYQMEFKTTGELLLLPAGSYDAITLWHVLEHVHDLHGYLASFQRILKPTGKLFIAVPNYSSYDADVYGDGWAAYDVPRHLYHFSPRSMELLMKEHGFTITEMRPMWFDSFYVSMLSEKYRGKHGYLLRAFWNGLATDIKTIFNKKACSSLIYIVERA